MAAVLVPAAVPAAGLVSVAAGCSPAGAACASPLCTVPADPEAAELGGTGDIVFAVIVYWLRARCKVKEGLQS